jgi:hypothetical protein
MQWGKQDKIGDTFYFKKASLVLDYMKVLLWPLIVVGILLVYRPPIGQIFQSLSSKLEKADSVAIGSFQLEVKRTARDLGNPGLATQIGELSFNAIEALVLTPRTGSMILLSTIDRVKPIEFGLPSAPIIEGLKELETKDLIEFDIDLKDFLAEIHEQGRRIPSDSSIRAEDRQWYAFEHLSENQKNKFKNEGYRLTDKGKSAVEAISKAVAAQLSKSK